MEEISQKTKITTRLLQAIENDQFDRLPGGLISRSFVRQYARELGIDEDMIVQEYVQASAERVEEPAELQSDTADQSISPAADYARIILAILGIGILLAGFGYGGYRLYSSLTADPLSAEARIGEPTAAVPAEAPTETAASDEPMAAPGREEQNAGLGGAAVISAVAAAAAPAAENEATPVAASLPQEEVAASLSQEELELQIASHSPVWLSITADGVREWQGTMQANQTRDVQAAESVNLTVGDAGAISLTLNGNPMPELGLPGQVRNLTITARDAVDSSP